MYIIRYTRYVTEKIKTPSLPQQSKLNCMSLNSMYPPTQGLIQGGVDRGGGWIGGGGG